MGALPYKLAFAVLISIIAGVKTIRYFMDRVRSYNLLFIHQQISVMPPMILHVSRVLPELSFNI